MFTPVKSLNAFRVQKDVLRDFKVQSVMLLLVDLVFGLVSFDTRQSHAISVIQYMLYQDSVTGFFMNSFEQLSRDLFA
jgi:hypothetical protein